MLVELVEEDFPDKHILTKFSHCRYVGMKLAKLGDWRAVHDGARRAAGMVVVGGVRIVVQCPGRERGEQILDVALQIEKCEWTRWLVHTTFECAPGRADA